MSRLDQFIKSKLRSHTTPVDTDQLWKDIQKKKRKRRGFFFLWWGVGVLGVLSMIFLIWNQMNSNYNSIHESSLKPDINTIYSDTISNRQDSHNSRRTVEYISKDNVISESNIKTSSSKKQITMSTNETSKTTIKNSITNEMEKPVVLTNNKSDLKDVKRKPKTAFNLINNKVTQVVKQNNFNSSIEIAQKKSGKSEADKLIAEDPIDRNSVAGNVVLSNKDKVKLKAIDSVEVNKESNAIADVSPVNVEEKNNLGIVYSVNNSNQVSKRNEQSDSNQSVAFQDSVLVISNTEPIAKQTYLDNNDSLNTVKENKISKPYFIKFDFGMSKVSRIFQWDNAVITS